MKIPQVSERTGVPPATLRWWRHKGTGPKSFKLSGRVAYFESDVERWLQDQYAASTEQAVDPIPDAR